MKYYRIINGKWVETSYAPIVGEMMVKLYDYDIATDTMKEIGWGIY